MTEENIPQHVGIIMDGNRRWAKQKGLLTFEGHRVGTENVEKIIEEAAKKGIKYLTFYILSTENYKKRSKTEIDGLMRLLEGFLKNKLLRLQKEEARLNILGNIAVLPASTQKIVLESVEALKNNSRIIINIAINYGGRNEIIRAANKAIQNSEKLTEENFNRFLDTAGQPDPNLIIRTGARRRLSNFLIWQAAYAEIYFSDTLWPDFTTEEFNKILNWYCEQKRTLGE